VSTTKLPLCDSEGRLIGTFGISRDITARRQAEEAIRQSETTLRSTFAAVPVGIAWIQSRTVRKINGVITRITGYSEEELIGQSTRMVYATEAESDRVGASFIRSCGRKGKRAPNRSGAARTAP
jgi:PAS domain-containing protein